MGNQRDREIPTGDGPAARVCTGSEAVLACERAVLGTEPARDPSVAEGAALAGVRAASVGSVRYAPRGPVALAAGVSCVHHLVAAPGGAGAAAFELAASSAEEALEHAVAAHRLSQRLGRPGVCSLAPARADDLGWLQLPDAAGLAALLDAPGPRETGADPDRVADLAREALAAARGAAAPVATVTGGGSEAAKVALVAAGGDAAAARAAARAASAAGIPTRWLALTLVHPFPVAEVRNALAGVRYVLALGASEATARWLAAALRPLLAEKAELGRAAGAGGPTLAAALRDALAAWDFEPSQLVLPLPAPLEHRLVVSPDSAWGERTARLTLAALARRGTLRIGRRARRHRAGLAVGFGFDGRHVAAGDLLLAGRAADLDPGGALSLLRPGSAVALLADGRTPAALLQQLTPATRAALREREHRVFAVACDHATDADPLTGAGDRAAACALADAAVAWLEGAAAGSGGTAAPADRAPRLHVFTADELSAGAPPEEIDFRAAPARLRLPEPPGATVSDEERERWAQRIRRFHAHGAADAAWPEREASVPASLALLADEIRSQPAHPFVLTATDGAPPAADSLHAFLKERLAALAAGGRGARVSAETAPALARCAADRIAVAPPGALLSEQLVGLGAELARRLGLSGEPASGVAADVDALFAELPAGVRAFDLRADTPLALFRTVLAAVRGPREVAFDHALRQLCDGLRDRLQIDRMSSDAGHTPAALSGELGGVASRYLDPDALASTLPRSPRWAVLDEELRRRIEATLAEIERHLEREAPLPAALFLHPPDLDPHVPDPEQSVHPDPLAAAVGYFDGLARGMAGLFGAVRRARLILAGSYRPEVHEEVLARLDWESFDRDELALLPAVTVVTTGSRLRERGQGSLSELLRSGRPLRVLVHDDPGTADEAVDPSRYHIDLGQLVMAHREAFALSSTLSRPGPFVERLVRLLGEPRPGVVLVQVAAGAPASLRPLLAEAALRGRACPDFLYDPEAGPSWADRFDVEGNPEPACAWPAQLIPCGEGAQLRTLESAFTFADAVALDPVHRRHLRAIPRQAWDDDVQVPLAGYLERLEPGVAVREIPFLWVVDGAGMLQRAVVTRELAVACRERLRTWRVLQEFGGFENAYAERAASAARDAASAEAAQERAELARVHAEALASAREAGARESMQQLAAALLSRDRAAAGAALPAAAPTAAANAVAPAVPAAAQAAPEDAAPAAEPEVEEPAEAELSLDEPWIEMMLCTSCNDCTHINPRMFQYNADKQAFIADATAGTFAELVQAAAKCPARCIHPGKPRSDDATATPDLIARAAEFN